MIGHETRMVQTEASTMVDLGDKLCVLEEDLKHFKMIMTQQIQTMDKKLNVLYQAMATLQPRAEVKRSSQTLKRSSDSDSEAVSVLKRKRTDVEHDNMVAKYEFSELVLNELFLEIPQDDQAVPITVLDCTSCNMKQEKKSRYLTDLQLSVSVDQSLGEMVNAYASFVKMESYESSRREWLECGQGWIAKVDECDSEPEDRVDIKFEEEEVDSTDMKKLLQIHQSVFESWMDRISGPRQGCTLRLCRNATASLNRLSGCDQSIFIAKQEYARTKFRTRSTISRFTWWSMRWMEICFEVVKQSHGIFTCVIWEPADSLETYSLENSVARHDFCGDSVDHQMMKEISVALQQKDNVKFLMKFYNVHQTQGHDTFRFLVSCHPDLSWTALPNMGSVNVLWFRSSTENLNVTMKLNHWNNLISSLNSTST